MLFKGDPVFVRVGADGRMALDGSGRAEMKYRETDAKSYRPAAANLVPAPQETEAATDGEPAPSPARRPVARPAAKRALPDAGGGAVEIWTDGACSGNPGPMGIGVVVIDGAHREEIGDYLGVGTNNIAELAAIERGLDVAAARVREPGSAAAGRRRMRVYSDSGYAIGLLDKGWKAKANQDLVARLRRKLATLDGAVEFVKVPGHAGVPENERCDALARAAISRRGAVT
jgi:ribonuclease HI